MAFSFQFNYNCVVFTSQIGEIGISSDSSAVNVQILQGNKAILNERYFTYGGKVVLYDIGGLMENNMRTKEINYALYSIKVFKTDGSLADSCTLSVLYCDRMTTYSNIESFLEENFLTTLAMRRVSPDDTFYLYYYGTEGEDNTVTINCLWMSSAVNDGNKSFTSHINGNGLTKAGVNTVIVNQSNIKEEISQVYGIRPSVIELVSLTVSVGERSITCFVDYSLKSNDGFYFRNCFNVSEVANLPISSTIKTEVERSTAVVNTTSSFYNQRVETVYEVQSGSLTSDEAEWIDQLFTSYNVTKKMYNVYDAANAMIQRQVLITDSTCEISDGDEKPNSVKFSWRFADNRALVRLSPSHNVFCSPPFNPIFD